VLLMMENHSFDQMLGCLDEVHPDLDGIGNAADRTNDDGHGGVFRLQPTEEKQVLLDPAHDHDSVMGQIADDNGGFVRVFTDAFPRSTRTDRQYVMGYYPRGFLNADGLHHFADWLRAETNAASADAVVVLAVEARGWTRFKHRVGQRVIAFGDWLEEDFVRHRTAREARTAHTVQAVRVAGKPDRTI
jgi:hypothetical protein